ncbi:MAG: radical SAM protein, partial [Chloroflexi bacterium]|nr:radical SAM protein [Chloroflexota bacterium]
DVLEPAAFRPEAREIVDVAAEHLAQGGTAVAFGRACDGEPLAVVRVLEEAVAGIRARAADVDVRLETSGSDPAALRRVLDAGLTSLTVRIASARPDTYEALHRPVAHRWSDVRAGLQLAAERHVPVTIALLVLPGLTDRAAEIEALVALLDEMPAGRLEPRDLGCDPLRTVAAFGRTDALGIPALIARLREADHFRLAAIENAPAQAVG